MIYQSFKRNKDPHMMSEDELKAHLNRICSECGEFFGKHRSHHNNCPEMEGKRTVGYLPNSYFNEWKEDK